MHCTDATRSSASVDVLIRWRERDEARSATRTCCAVIHMNSGDNYEQAVGGQGRGRGHPYRVPVNNKNTFSGPKSFAARKKSAAYRFGSAVGCFCRVTLTYRNVLAPSFCFAPACSLWIHSSSPPAGRPASLSCSHPSGSRPRLRRHATAAPGPIPTRRDQNNVSTAPGSNVAPPARGTGHTCD